jgi:hypothetical protein
MHGLHTSTQYLNETLEPLNWIRVSQANSRELTCSVKSFIEDQQIYEFQATHKSFPLDIIPSTGSHLRLCKAFMNVFGTF